jgi:hypothetical protein
VPRERALAVAIFRVSFGLAWDDLYGSVSPKIKQDDHTPTQITWKSLGPAVRRSG